MTSPVPEISEIKFDQAGLVPCVMQSAQSGEVLTLAFMNAEAVQKTLDTKEVWFYSRSRQELWHKGATSGNFQRLVSLGFDCDQDALIALVEPAGPACHTGARSCFEPAALSGQGLVASFIAPGLLAQTIAQRVESGDQNSYSLKLVNDREFNIEKVLEEAEEVTRAAREESDERVANEAADVIYHLATLMAGRGMSLQAAFDVLNERAK